MQVRGQGNFYRELRDKGFFINAPDDYFFQGITVHASRVLLHLLLVDLTEPLTLLSFRMCLAGRDEGTNKEGVGYNENQFSLPREEQLVITRATLYEVRFGRRLTIAQSFPHISHYLGETSPICSNNINTILKTRVQGTFIMPPTAVWSFVPLVDYHAGGSAASFWPPSQHIDEYELALAMHMSYGVAACYRGPGLYDTPAVKDMVGMWVGWFKQHRRILTSDLIHIRRPDGQSIDGIVHVDAAASPTDEVALAAFFNPTTEQLNTTFMVPLYYAGVAPNDIVNITRAEPVGAHLAATPANAGAASRFGVLGSANFRSRVELEVIVPAGGYAMFSIFRRH